MIATLGGIDEEIIGLVAVAGGLSVAIIAIVVTSIKSVANTKAREATKRELAAYIAEGSMNPEDAERILKSDMKAWEKS